MNSADKILRIARGGKPITPEMSAADRVMAYAMPEAEPQTQAQIQPPTQPQDNSAWGRFKNFAGSNGGRTLWGGLGTALAVGLTGGNVKDALGYGVIGAGNTVETLNQNKQYQNALQERQLERQRKIDEAAKNRQFLQQQQTRAFGNQQQMANLQYENSLNSMLIGKIVDHGWEADKPARELAAKKRAIQLSDLPDGKKDFLINNLYGMKDDDYYSYLLTRDPNNPDALDYFNNKNKVGEIVKPKEPLTIGDVVGIYKDGDVVADPDRLNEAILSNDFTKMRAIAKPQSTSDSIQAYRAMVANGMPPEKAAIVSGVNKFGYSAGLEKVKAILGEQKSQNDFWRNVKLEDWKNSLSNENRRYIEAKARREGRTVDDVTAELADKWLAKQDAEINNINSQIKERGTTPQITNAKFIEENPQFANSPAFRGGTNVSVNTGDTVQGGISDKKLIEARTANYAKAEEAYRQSLANRENVNRRVSSLIQDLQNNPDVVGAYAGWNEKYHRYTNTNPEWLEARGRVVRGITDMGNELVAQAYQNGITGINTLEEVKRIVANLTADASPEEIRGALSKMQEAAEDITRKSWQIYQGFDNPLPDYAPYGGDGQPVNRANERVIDYTELLKRGQK